MAIPRGDDNMTRIEKIVLNAFLSEYPDVSYEQVIASMGISKKIEFIDIFKDCDPQELRERMYFLYVDIMNLVNYEILEYDKKFLNSSSGDKKNLNSSSGGTNVAVQ